ncbi:hypothetical protein FPCIR_11867 [Fusarium pseudocircinatum]|uniref:Uncharacterized protein n=1 Tax=Fusarium pseudocircinatum TaxID=56676 RepID=A0A8H5NTS3_9HYPO|nr:hypothetical protein FPCIR_11867 [Fusarium pseudocircinatum]
MSSQSSSSTAAESSDSRPPPHPQPPERLERHLQGRKAIFFTLDTLFNRDFATEHGLKRCKRVSPALRDKSMDELKRAYHNAMAAAYLNYIKSMIPGTTSQASMDKIELMFRELNLSPPSTSDKRFISRRFTAEFNRNRFEVAGASETLAQLKNLGYAIVIADDDLKWDVVEDLNFWQYIDANIISNDLVRRKPDRSVFKRALDACGVSPKNTVIVGCSIEKDIVGILNAGAEPILYMPDYNFMHMDVQGKRVLVVRSMPELLSVIRRRPENRHLVTAQRYQPPPNPSHPPMVYGAQNQGYTNGQNGGPSNQHHHEGSSQFQRPASNPKPIDDRHATQPREKVPLSRILSQPGPSNETPRRHKLPDRGHPTKFFEKTAHPVPPLSGAPAKRPYESRSGYGYVSTSSYHYQGYADHDPAKRHQNPAGRANPGPSTQNSSPDTPQFTGQPMGPNGDGSDTLHEEDIPLEPQSRIKPPAPATPGIRISKALGFQGVNMGFWARFILPEINIRLGLQVRIKPRTSLESGQSFNKSDHRAAFIPGDPSRQPSHGDLNSTSAERWSTPRPQADEQHKARPSNQKRSRPMYEDTAVHREVSDEYNTGSSPDTLAPQFLSSETARPNDVAAEPPHKRQRATEELREIAQTVLNPEPKTSTTSFVANACR